MMTHEQQPDKSAGRFGNRVQARWRPLRLAGYFALFGTAWILATDYVVDLFFSGVAEWARMQTVKGLAFIAITTLFVYWLARRVKQGMEQDLMEEELRLTEGFLSNLLSGLGDAIVLVDPSSRLITTVNPAAVQMFGYSEDEIIGQSTQVIHVSEESFREFGAVGEPILEKGQVFRTEYELKRKDWTVFHADITVSAMRTDQPWQDGVVSIIRDTTERQEAAAKLQEATLKLNTALSAGRIGLWDWDLQTNHVWYSSEWKRQLGCEEEDIPDSFSAWEQRVHPDDLASSVAHITSSLASDEDEFHLEFRMKHEDGSYRWILSNATVFRNEDGEPVRVLGSHTDITELRQSEASRTEIAEELRQAQKMESVGRLAGGIAHDFNNKLSVICGFAELAMMNLEATHPLYTRVHQIHKAGVSASDLTRQLLAFARQQAIEPRVVMMNDLVETMWKMLERLIGENIELRWQPRDDLWQIHMDPGQLDQIVANLVVNARDAIDGSGIITVATHNSQLTVDDNACCPETPPGDYVMLSVSDSGSGMSEETMQSIFEPFFTTKPRGKGTGLGLSTVYGIVKQNHGAIQVESTLGEGTTFRVYLPRWESEAGEGNALCQSLPMRPGTESILLVEDEPPLLEYIHEILEEAGYDVTPTSSPFTALKIASDPDRRIDLLLTDLVMPEMNGKILAEKVRQLRPDIKCLFMSGYTADIIADHGIGADAITLIQKPFGSEEMGKGLRDVLDSATPRK